MAFYYAELLFKLQRYDEAAKMYERSVDVEPHGSSRDEAAYAYVISTKNAVEAAVARDPTRARPARTRSRARFRPTCSGSSAPSIATSRSSAKTDGVGRTMEYRRARLYYDYQHFAEAAPLFDHIFVAYPDNELATYSANLEMDCLAILKRYSELRALVERVKKSPIMKDATTQQQVRDVEAGLKKNGK